MSHRDRAVGAYPLSWFVLLVIQAFAVLLPACAAVTEAWVQQSTSSASGVGVDSRGDVFVCGRRGLDLWVAKYSGSTSRVLWEIIRNGPSNLQDRATALALDSAGDVIVTGQIDYDFIMVRGGDYYTAKLSGSDGTLLWEQRWKTNTYELPSSVAVDKENDVVVTGHASTVKYRGSNGALVWAYSAQQGWSVTTDGNNDVIVTGAAGTRKHSGTNGSVVWTQPIQGLSVAVDSHNDVITAGTAYPAVLYPERSRVGKLSGTDGAVLWEHATNFLHGVAVAVDGEGNAYVTGHAAYRLTTVKYATNGTTLWTNQLPRIIDESTGQGVQVDAAGGVAVAGHRVGPDNLRQFYTARYSAETGAALWERTFQVPGFGPPQVATNGIAVGPDGLVAVVGNEQPYSSVTLVYRESLPPMTLTSAGTEVRLSIPVVSNRTYHMLSAPLVTGPWVTNSTFTANTNGWVEVVETNTAGARFYRTAAGP